MASEAQIAANRANAGQSTGPKTLEGKENSRQNAVRHGLRARTASALGEDDSDFIEHHAKLVMALLPYDAYEFVLVRRLAQLSWRLERLAGMEAAMLDGVAHRVAAIQARYAHDDDPSSFESGRPADDLWTPDMPLIARYEATLDRAFSRNMAALERYRATRRPPRQAAPVSDVEAPAPDAPDDLPSKHLSPDAAPGVENPPRNVFLPNEPNLQAASQAGTGGVGDSAAHAHLTRPSLRDGSHPLPPMGGEGER